MISDVDLLFLMNQAIDSDHGIVIAVSNVEVFQRRFYAVRAAEMKHSPELKYLSLHKSPTNPDTEVWLRRKADADNA